MSAKQPSWRRYLRFWGSNVADDIDAELRFHIEMRTREYVARGMTEANARQAVLARLGRVDAARDACLAIGRENERRQHQASLIESASADVRFALRSLARSPSWTAVALLTIALGVGASTAVFSIVDRLLVRPVDYPGASRVFVVRREIGFPNGGHVWMTPTMDAIRAWQQSARSIETAEGYVRREMAIPTGGADEVANVIAIDTSFLTFTGARPLLGRPFTAEETRPNGPAVVLLTESFWRRQFGGDPDIVGKTLRSTDQTLTIVGVLPASLQVPELRGAPVDLWVPLTGSRERRVGGAVVRLRPGVTPTAASSELDAIAARAGGDPLPADMKSRTVLLRPSDTLDFRKPLLMLAGAVALLLLVACANVAHLSLARGAARERELAVRYALGAGRWRLVRQLVTESLVLSVLGGAIAVLVGAGGLRLANGMRPETLNALARIPMNQSVLLTATILTIVTGVAVGLLVALRTARHGMGESLRVGAGTGRATRRLRSSLAVTEIALSATLLVGALLLVRSVINLQRTKIGFDPRHLYGVTFSLRGTPLQLGSPAQRTAFAARLLERGRRISGAAGVTLAQSLPPDNGFVVGNFETPDGPVESKEPVAIGAGVVSGDYFALLGIPLTGATFDPGSDARHEVIINEAFAAKLWPNTSPIGRRFRGTGNADSSWYTVIGVTKNSLMHGLVDGASTPGIYYPIDSELENGLVTLVVRGRDGVTLGPEIERVAAELRIGAAMPRITNVEQALSDSLAEPRFSMVVLTTFAVLAVVLAAIGLYGVIAYTVAQRTREIGIRITLGATRAGIARLVVGDGLRLSLIGIVLGLAGALAATRLIQTTLYGVERGDPWSFAIGAVILIAISALACLVPTLRATAVDPVIAVRAE